MYTIQAKELTQDAFKKYGVYQDLTDDEKLAEASIIPSDFFADVIMLEFGKGNMPTVSVCAPQKKDKMVISFLEAHQFTCEGLLPLDDDVVIFVGVPGNNAFSVRDLEAFIVPKGTFIKLNPYIVHGTQYPLNREEAHVLCLLPGRTFKNDMIAHPLKEEEFAEIIL